MIAKGRTVYRPCAIWLPGHPRNPSDPWPGAQWLCEGPTPNHQPEASQLRSRSTSTPLSQNRVKSANRFLADPSNSAPTIALSLLRSAMFTPSVVCAPRMGGSIRVIIPSRKKPHKRVTEIFAANTPKRCSTMCSQRAWGCGSGLRLATAEDACGLVISSTP